MKVLIMKKIRQQMRPLPAAAMSVALIGALAVMLRVPPIPAFTALILVILGLTAVGLWVASAMSTMAHGKGLLVSTKRTVWSVVTATCGLLGIWALISISIPGCFFCALEDSSGPVSPPSDYQLESRPSPQEVDLIP